LRLLRYKVFLHLVFTMTTRSRHHRKAPSSPEVQSPFFDKDGTNHAFFQPGEPAIQAKLTISQPGDVFEQEADRVADTVVNHQSSPQVQQKPEGMIHRQPMEQEEESPVARQAADKEEEEPPIARQAEKEEEEEPPVARQAADKEEEETPIARQTEKEEEEEPPVARQMADKEEEETPIQTKANDPHSPGPLLSRQLNHNRGQGQPLPASTHAEMSNALGYDFSDVTVHTDAQAVRMNRELNAQAFTQGKDVYFNEGKYDPDSRSGKRLLAHELTHVVQQTGGQPQRPKKSNEPISHTPGSTIQRAIQDVQQSELSTFISQPERALPQPLIDKYLVDPALMATQRRIIRTLVNRVQSGAAPLTANQFQELVLGQESDLGTALIICHNVAKALARGQSPINWANVSRNPLVYSLNGTRYAFDSANFHRDAIEFSSRGQESVFYAMLSVNQFGQRDEGDWYHYYATAATSYYRASGNLQTSPPSRQLDPITQFTGDLVRRVADALRDSSVTASSAYEGWLLANATSFLEGAHYGQSQNEVNAESDIHMQGASGGLAAVGRIPEENWAWYVPRAGSISLADLSNFRFRPNMIATTWTGVDGNFELTIISGSTPSHWYDTPDPLVKLPGFFGSRTTTKENTPTPVWNEVLTTLPYSSLASITLQLYDADLTEITNDHITDFTDDLRTRGQRSRNFSLTSGSSSLEVRVQAVGNVTLAHL
jgi:hypothetical protein